MDYLTIRKKTGLFQYRRVVPLPLRLALGKGEIVISLQTDDRSLALQRYPEAHRRAELLLRKAGAIPREDIVYQRTMADLKAAGLNPKDAVTVEPVPIDYTAQQDRYGEAMLKALAADDPTFTPMTDPPNGFSEALGHAMKQLPAYSPKQLPSVPKAYPLSHPSLAVLDEVPAYRLLKAAFLGVDKPKHRLSQARDYYLAMTATKANLKNHTKQCDLVIKALVEIVGKPDPALDDLTLDVAEMFRAKMTESSLAPSTVRRRITTIKALLTRYIKDKRLSKDLENNFNGLTVSDPEGLLDKERRDALTLEDIRACIPFIQDKNADIQDLWLLQMFTGARPSEFRGLSWEDVDLDHATPNVLLRYTEERRLKTKVSKRMVPLVGKALSIMIIRKEARIKGDQVVFPRYAGSGGMDSVSTLQIKAMKQAKVWVKTKKVPYSLRHSVRDWVVRKAGTSWAERLQGHESGSQNGDYGSDDMLDLLAGHLTAALKAGGVWHYPLIQLKDDAPT